VAGRVALNERELSRDASGFPRFDHYLRSEIHGAPPTLHGAATQSAEMEHLVSVVQSWLDGDVQVSWHETPSRLLPT
jgi:hypothetical protein